MFCLCGDAASNTSVLHLARPEGRGEGEREGEGEEEGEGVFEFAGIFISRLRTRNPLPVFWV